MNFVHLAESSALFLDVAGVLVMVVGIASVLIAGLVRYRRERDIRASYLYVRRALGRVILLSLELLVASDIIATIAVEPTLSDLTVLAIVVLIRTFLSFTLETELDGRWPWQRSPQEDQMERRRDTAASR